MGRKKVTVANIGKAVNKIMMQYAEITWENVDEAMSKVAKKARTAVANGSRQFDERWGYQQYSRGWRVKVDKKLWYSDYIIHNSKKPTETHLLEYGHEMIRGMPYTDRKTGQHKVVHTTRSRAFPHITPVANEMPNTVQSEVVDAIRRSS